MATNAPAASPQVNNAAEPVPNELASAREPGDDLAADRVLLHFARFVAAGYLFYLVAALAWIPDGAAVTASWWTPTAVTLIYGSAIVLGILTFSRRPEVLRPALAACALSYLISSGLWLPAWNGGQVDHDQGMWFSQFIGLPSLAAAAAWRPRWALTHLFVGVLLMEVIKYLVRDDAHNHSWIPEAAWSIGFCLLPVTAGIMAIRTGRILDETRAQTFAAAARSAATLARSTERMRFDALTHDGVMSTLLSAARNSSSPALTAQARSTLAQLDDLRGTDPSGFEIGGAQLAGQIRAAVGEIDNSIAVETTVTAGGELANYPREVGRTIAAAAAEAARNSLRHGGDHAKPSVSLSVDQNSIDVTVADRGVGFVAAAVPANRLGIAVSIRGRMQSLPGGAARVESRVGNGTTVRLGWRRQ